MNKTEREIIARGMALALGPRLKKVEAEQADVLAQVEDLQDRLTVAERIIQGLALRLEALEARQ